MNLPGITQVPVADLVVAPYLAAWSAAQPYDGHPPNEIGASKLGGCSRAVVYDIRSTPPSNPIDESGLYSTAFGTLAHRAIQEQIVEAPEAALEAAGWADVMIDVEDGWKLFVPVEGHSEPLVIASDADLNLTFSRETEDGVEVVDIKTMKPFGFLMKVGGANGGEPEGPERSHLLQVGMAMKAEIENGIPADEVHGRLVYLSTAELAGRDKIVTDDEFAGRTNRNAEFTFPWSAVADLVEYEVKRLSKIAEFERAGRVVPRTIPGVTPKGAVVVGFNEAKRRGLWQKWGEDAEGEPTILASGETWVCGYCPWRDVCMSEMENERGNLTEVED